MSRYTIIITSKDNQRLHFRTNNKILIKFMYDCSTRSLNVPVAKNLSIDEMMIVEAYLNSPLCCEVQDNHTKQLIQLPV
ncbi:MULTISPECIES: hypothetical protein [Solibacillus]|uniref:Uncharacterized protein n=1 Tax=Solibacillus merdavium TaxID=2762218 RepID=A0ABR8XR75_9BACL|nr:hypothetical protein [Solibacillus merdavium]MBD8034382.1 hypothetical protein [Solibacillus merdavium]